MSTTHRQTYRCHTCGELLPSCAASETHADSHHGARLDLELHPTTRPPAASGSGTAPRRRLLADRVQRAPAGVPAQNSSNEEGVSAGS